MNNPNRELLLAAARALRPLLDEVVFVGGCATGLLITDEGAPDIRRHWTLMFLPKSRPMLNIIGSAVGFTSSVSRRIRARALLSAAGSTARSRWTSCRSTKKFWVSEIDGTGPQCNQRTIM